MSLETLLRTKSFRSIVPAAVLAVASSLSSEASAQTPAEIQVARDNGRRALVAYTPMQAIYFESSSADGRIDYFRHTHDARPTVQTNEGTYTMPLGVGSLSQRQVYLFTKYAAFCNILEMNAEECKGFVSYNISESTQGRVNLAPSDLRVLCSVVSDDVSTRNGFYSMSSAKCSEPNSFVRDVLVTNTSLFSDARDRTILSTVQETLGSSRHAYFRKNDSLRVRSDDYLRRHRRVNPQVTLRPACSDGIDNDGDGFIDMADPGCTGASDIDEGNNVPVPVPVVLPQCSDGVDNDGDGLVDLNDLGCENNPQKNNEFNATPVPPTPVTPECMDGIDNDRDGLVDLFDPGCAQNPYGASEWNISPGPNPWPVPPPTPRSDRYKKDLDLRLSLGYLRSPNQDMPGFSSAYVGVGGTWYPQSWEGHGFGLDAVISGFGACQDYTLDPVVHQANPADPYALTGVHTQGRSYCLWNLDLVPHLTLRPGTDHIYLNFGVGPGFDFVSMSSQTNERLQAPNGSLIDESNRETTGVGGSKTYGAVVFEVSTPLAVGRWMGWDPLYIAPKFRARVHPTDGSEQLPTRDSVGGGADVVFMW